MESLEIGSIGDNTDYIQSSEKASESNLHNINNIFLHGNNLNFKNILVNKCNPPNSFREVSLAFSKGNICRILKVQGIDYYTVSKQLEKYGKRKPFINQEEVGRILDKYINVVGINSFDDDVVTSFINMYQDGSINSILSYHMIKANAKVKRNSDVVGATNLICNFNVDNFRKFCFGIDPSDMNFNATADREIFILDYVSIYWELYMLLVFYMICKIATDNEDSFFEHFHRVIQLAMFTGKKMFVQFELTRHYGELYEELRGFKPINDKYMFVDDVMDKQQLYFIMKNANFLNEAYRKEYNNPTSIPITEDVKADKHIDIEFCIKKGSIDNSVLFEVAISGQNPIGRIYSTLTDPEIVINMTNIYHYGLSVVQPVVYLFRQLLAYSKDEEKISYYTEIHNYLQQFKGKIVRNLVSKQLEVILLILYERPNKEELEQYINEYFALTDKVQKAEFRRIYKELEIVLQPKKVRLIDRLREELWNIVW
ncbi:MAG: hypothetical protein NC200_01015 [Candidatus Gastranaerophilales bacterium]|nr:hypothetical protein [Candidatus Gastranaerophilales bacterium]